MPIIDTLRRILYNKINSGIGFALFLLCILFMARQVLNLVDHLLRQLVIMAMDGLRQFGLLEVVIMKCDYCNDTGKYKEPNDKDLFDRLVDEELEKGYFVNYTMAAEKAYKIVGYALIDCPNCNNQVTK